MINKSQESSLQVLEHELYSWAICRETTVHIVGSMDYFGGSATAPLVKMFDWVWLFYFLAWLDQNIFRPGLLARMVREIKVLQRNTG